MLDALAHVHARATFFVVGKLARAHPQLVRRAICEGHTIGNHTWSHRHPWTLTSEAGRREVLDGAAAVADITGTQPAYFRPPHGRLNRCMMETAMATGQSVLLWSLSVRDWGAFGRAGSITERLGRARSEDIVLMHDGPMRINRPDQLLRALPEFLYQNRDRWRYRELGTRPSVR